MKKNIIITAFAAIMLVAMSACEDNIDVRPGLWTELDVIETFPGDTVLVSGQVSNYVGLESVELRCDAWNVYHKYELDGKHSKVFNMDYKLIVPDDATFDQVLMITVTDTHGTEQKKAVTLTFKPDDEAPQVTNLTTDEIVVEYNSSTKVGLCQLELNFSDDRALSQATIDISGIGFNESFPLKGRETSIYREIEFANPGNYLMTLMVEDESGNVLLRNINVIVMAGEIENPFSDYAQMYVVNADANPDDYIWGYYRYMDRTDAYTYSCKLYAPYDNYKVYFVPEQSLTGDLFGASPVASSKLINNNGYAVPVTVEKKGYYWAWINLQDHQYGFSPMEIEDGTHTGSLVVTGTGFASMGDWTFSNVMSAGDTNYRKTITLNLNPNYSSDYTYCFTNGTWDLVWRCGSNQWWWLDDQGWGGEIASFVPNGATTVEITFDTAELWSTIKKVNK